MIANCILCAPLLAIEPALKLLVICSIQLDIVQWLCGSCLVRLNVPHPTRSNPSLCISKLLCMLKRYSCSSCAKAYWYNWGINKTRWSWKNEVKITTFSHRLNQFAWSKEPPSTQCIPSLFWLQWSWALQMSQPCQLGHLVVTYLRESPIHGLHHQSSWPKRQQEWSSW